MNNDELLRIVSAHEIYVVTTRHIVHRACALWKKYNRKAGAHVACERRPISGCRLSPPEIGLRSQARAHGDGLLKKVNNSLAPDALTFFP